MSREVLAPPLQRMGTNRCYRVNLVHPDFGGHQKQQKQHSGGYEEKDLYGADDYECDDEEVESADCTVEESATGMFKLTFHVAQAFYGGLIGFKGSTKRRIESETKTEIYVPGGRGGGSAAATKSEDINIKGKTRSSVFAAKRKINLLIHSLRKRMRPTHFLCVTPSNSDVVRTNFNKFKKEVLDSNLPNINEQMFQRDTKIHLTLSTCVLLDDAERAKALEVLQNCREFLTGLTTPFALKISGLEIMNDDPSAVRVLYACVEAPALQQFANNAFQRFIQSGLAFDEHERQGGEVKLHMTLMNIRYAETTPGQATAKNFDAREILKTFGDYDFGSDECDEVKLCVLGSAKAREFYKKEILDRNLPGIDEGLIQQDVKLHLTLSYCGLLDDADLSKALEVLQNCRGLGFDEHKGDKVKLHMVLMEARYTKVKNFDAREILKTFGDYEFGTAKILQGRGQFEDFDQFL